MFDYGRLSVMGKYRRSQIELCIDVLRAICNGRKVPSRIVCAANLSYDRVMCCIDFLVNQGLVEITAGDRKLYSVTERGRDVMRYFDEVESIFCEDVYSGMKLRYNGLLSCKTA